MFFKWFEPKPYNQGYLPEVDGHKVFFMEVGNPKGKPVLVFHGGPGGRCKAKSAAVFDLKKYRVIMFDQRGCGNSTPKGQWENNTPEYTLFDANRLLEHLGVDVPIIVRGGSYGSTLSLLFAIKNPNRVEKLLLSQIFLATLDERKWLEETSGLFYADILDEINKQARGAGNPAFYYAKLINSGERKKQQKALSYFGSYEYLLGQLEPKLCSVEVNEDNLASARISMNYFANDFYLKDNYIIKNIKKIAHIPTLIVHNRLDFVCPPSGALKLKKNMQNVDFVMVADSGHVSKLLYKTLAKKIRAFLKND